MEKKFLKFKEMELSNDIKRGLSELGFVRPLEVQEKVFPMIMAGKDLIVKSQTGSGKTAAFGIPICELVDMEADGPQVLILTPTRELAMQIKYDIDGIGKHKGIRCAAVFGKQPMQTQRQELRKKPHVIAATPGRMMDHLINKNVKMHNLKYLVIDEADEMLMMGFGDQIDAIVAKIPDERTTLLFSATMPQKVEYLSQKYMKDAEFVEVVSDVNIKDKIEQIHYKVEALKKVDYLKRMLQREKPTKTLIFCNTQEQVERLFAIMKKWSYQITAVHGAMDQRTRMDKLTQFKNGQYHTLIATDVAARGIHVDGITHVVNFFVPFDHENYVHRIGRTGRVDANGIAITLVTETENERFVELEKFLGYEIPCLGGHVARRVSKKDLKKKKNRYVAEKSKGAMIEINSGQSNSRLKVKDIISAFSSVNGVFQGDIGKIEIKDKVTFIEIKNGKEADIIKTFRTAKIRDKIYRVKQKNNDRTMRTDERTPRTDETTRTNDKRTNNKRTNDKRTNDKTTRTDDKRSNDKTTRTDDKRSNGKTTRNNDKTRKTKKY